MTRLEFTGGPELAAALQTLAKRASTTVALEALAEAAEPLRARMEDDAPVETGRLADVMVISRSRGRDAREQAVAVGASRPGFYGSFVEFGTAHMGPQPWARPAFDQTWQACLRLLASGLWSRLAARGVAAAFSRVSFGGSDRPSVLQDEV